jgi:hypothetical protein
MNNEEKEILLRQLCDSRKSEKTDAIISNFVSLAGIIYLFYLSQHLPLASSNIFLASNPNLYIITPLAM